MTTSKIKEYTNDKKSIKKNDCKEYFVFYRNKIMIDTGEWEESVLQNTIGSYYKDYGQSDLQITNYNHFLQFRLEKIVENDSVLEVKISENEYFRVEFSNVHVEKPYIIDENRTLRYITPMEARMRDLNYSGTLFVNIKTSFIKNGQETEVKYYERKMMAKIPIMVQSIKCNLHGLSQDQKEYKGECKYDTGGYFIIKGKERALVSQERMNYNVVYVFEQKQNTKFQMVAEIRSMSEETRHSVFVQMKIHNKKIFLQIPYIQQDIPLGVVYRAFGFTVEDTELFLKLHCYRFEDDKVIQSYVHSILLDVDKIGTQENAIHYICEFSLNSVMKERKRKYIIQILNNELFPHLGIISNREQKGMFLANMFQKLIMTFVGYRKLDDRDHINNKRIEMSGCLVGDLFRTLFKRFVRTIEGQLEKRQDIVVITNRVNMITLGLNHSFATGNWGIPKSSYIRTGVSQILSRLTYVSFCSHLRRILVPIGKEGKNTKVRQIHTSQIGFICPHETPEGQQSGIVKNMTSFLKLSNDLNPTYVLEILEKVKSVETDMNNILDKVIESKIIFYIFINGNLIGYTYDFDETWKKFMNLKMHLVIPSEVSISFSKVDREIHIFTDEGRMLRPLFNRKNFPTLEEIQHKSFKTLLQENKIIYLDSYQIENYSIAMTKEEMESQTYYQLCEIHPSCISGLSVSLIPFPDHTQSPRVTYHAAMGKQAIGLPFTNTNYRMDTIHHMLCYPEKPIIQSHHAEMNHGNELPFGSNLIVAVLTYTGFNQEDSVIMNRGAVERGLFRSFAFKMIVVEEKKRSNVMNEKICLVPNEYRNKSFDYSKVDADGIAKVGVYLGVGDVVVSKLQKVVDKSSKESHFDTSVIIKSGEEGMVDKVYTVNNSDGYKIIKIKIRSYRIPEIGDKVASRCAQKGTISVVLNQEDMPFTASGIVPDLIINPLCIPSRMTINQLIECFSAKSSVFKSEKRYSTAFSNHSKDIIPYLQKQLEECGFDRNGNEVMFNGMTGQAFESKIFIGPTYYHRLKHLVGNKIHARNHGNIQALTRQPLEGRSRDGGLRFGEMERDTTHYKTPISLKCGLSVPLYEFKDHKKWDVLGWEEETDSIVTKKQTEFLDKGEKECVEITLQDGRKLTCTPDHPMLTMEKNWIRAKNLKVKGDKLKVSLHYPTININEDMKLCNNWKMNIGDILLKMETKADYLRSLSFMRMMGLLCSDGGFYKQEHIIYGKVNLGHSFDADAVKDDMEVFTQNNDVGIHFRKTDWNGYFNIRLPQDLTQNLLHLEDLTIGSKIDQPIRFPKFILDENLPTPLLREFLGALFGGDGHTCYLTKHRGKRDFLTSISFSRSSLGKNMEHLLMYMKQLQKLLKRCGVEKVTIQSPKETSWSKNQNRKCSEAKCYQLTLHLDMSELIPFHDKIGFRYCCHKSLRLEAGVSYRRLRETTMKQHDWIVDRVNELTDFANKKKENPNKIVPTKKAIIQATKELQEQEAILHKYAIPTTHDITDHLVKGTKFGSFRSSLFPTAEEFMEQIGALEWFDDDYATKSNSGGLPTMNLEVIDIRPVGKHLVYDIEVDKIHSFLANGIVAHNCMISHGVSRFLRERLFDVSDYFEIHVCESCGTTPHDNKECNVCKSKQVKKVPLPFACKLLFQELSAMGIKVNIFPKRNE